MEHTLEHMAELLLKLPSLPKLSEVGHGSSAAVFCRQCKKQMDLFEVKHYWTGLLQAHDALCDRCLPQFKKHAVIVCSTCGTVVMRMFPHRDSSGFVFEKSQCYHLSGGCIDCNKNLGRTFIVEMAMFKQEKRK